MIRFGIRAQLTAWYAAALTLVLLVYAGGLYLALRNTVLDELDRKLREDIEAAEELIPELTDPGPADAAIDLLEDRERWLLEIWALTGSRISSVPAISDEPLGGVPRQCDDRIRFETVTRGDGLELRVGCAEVRHGEATLLVRSARSAARLTAELERIRLWILLGLPVSVALAALGGGVLARRALRPVRTMTEMARRISAENLSERIAVPPAEDELSMLARTFNGAFARLEEAFDQMRRFTADASHELRTPIATIRATGEVALQRGSGSAIQQEALSTILETADRMRELIEGLLTLSRADAGQLALKRERFDLVDVTREIVERLTILAEEKGQKLTLEGSPTQAYGDARFVRQAISNIIDNSIRHGPPNSTVRVTVRSREGRALVDVTDEGPGIAQEHVAKIFDRFYRVDTGRDRAQGGVGLGLAITKWVAVAHGGTVRVTSTPGSGATFTLELPVHT